MSVRNASGEWSNPSVAINSALRSARRRNQRKAVRRPSGGALQPRYPPEDSRDLRGPNQKSFRVSVRHFTEPRRSACRVDQQLGYADTPVTGVEELENSVRLATEAGQSVESSQAVFATNSPINNRVALLRPHASISDASFAGTPPSNVGIVRVTGRISAGWRRAERSCHRAAEACEAPGDVGSSCAETNPAVEQARYKAVSISSHCQRGGPKWKPRSCQRKKAAQSERP